MFIQSYTKSAALSILYKECRTRKRMRKANKIVQQEMLPKAKGQAHNLLTTKHSLVNIPITLFQHFTVIPHQRNY
jgi:hypothetical protein